jgi:hypothetical protein
MTFNIPPPTNITNLFGNWFNGMEKKDKGHIRVGVSTSIWVIWHVHHSCRLSLWLHTGSIGGPISSRRKRARKWLLGATVWQWLHMILTVGAIGDLRGTLHEDSIAFFYF